MLLVVGLGNPGRKYRKTRHNIGHICIDYYAHVVKTKLKSDKKFQGDIAKVGDVVFLKPTTYMNLSGISVRSVQDYFDIATEDILVIHDDLDLPPFKLRLKDGGGDGGHKGIRSIASSLSDEGFKRLRIGIGRPRTGMSEAHVLSNFSKEEIPEAEAMLDTVGDILHAFVKKTPFLELMNRYN